MSKPPVLKAPPLSLDDDADDLVSSLKRKPAETRQLPPEAREALRHQAETSPLITTKSHRRPAEPAPPPPKVVRDGYCMPVEDHSALENLARFALRQEAPIGKSGILRLGVRLLATLPEEDLARLIRELPPVPTGKRKR